MVDSEGKTCLYCCVQCIAKLIVRLPYFNVVQKTTDMIRLKRGILCKVLRCASLAYESLYREPSPRDPRTTQKIFWSVLLQCDVKTSDKYYYLANNNFFDAPSNPISS